ncbi:unnamed protein product, partial [marine sediment metagenome]
ELEEQVKHLDAMVIVFEDLSRPQVVRLAGYRMYLDFCMRIIQLESAGVPVLPAMIDEARGYAQAFIGGTK